MMPTPKAEPASERERPDYRVLYVGQDVDWFRRLKGALGLPANRLVYCAGGSSVGRFLKSNIRYDLFLFDLDRSNTRHLFSCVARHATTSGRENRGAVVQNSYLKESLINSFAMGAQGSASLAAFHRIINGS